MPLDQAGSNTAGNDSAVNWMRQYRTQKRLCDEANGVLRNILKRAKSDGMDTKAMINAVKATKLNPDEVVAGLRNEITYLGLLHVKMTQSDIFENFDLTVTEKTEREDDLWDAEDAGYKAGRHGVKVEACPYTAGTEHHVHWREFGHKGQHAIAAELGPDVKMANPARGRGRPRKNAAPEPEPADPNQQDLGLASDDPPYVPSAPAIKATRRRGKGNGADRAAA